MHSTVTKTILFSLILLCLKPITAWASFNKLSTFGENPGALTASYYSNNPTSNNIIVLLHGCVQNGEQLAKQSGFLGLAKNHNFALLVPQQNLKNNKQNCFNWFSPQDTNKNQGESLSIKHMINALKIKVKAKNIYIVGLSAGGAMASSMLINYPELFKSGAIVAGIPYLCADNLIKAISCMRSGPSQSAKELTAIIEEKNIKQLDWPTISIWTGKQDQIVSPLNSILLAQHWKMLTQSKDSPQIEMKKNYQISRWKNQKDKTLVELIELENIGHGFPVKPELLNGGSEAPFLLKSPISAAVNILNFWNIR